MPRVGRPLTLTSSRFHGSESGRLLVREAGPIGWLRLFVDSVDEMEQRLRQQAARSESPLAVARILAAFGPRSTIAEAPDQRRLAEPLTSRELEILALLGARESNKEIAAR